MDSEIWPADIEEIDTNFGDYLEIKGMDSGESFQFMADFVDTVDNEKIEEQLIGALNRPIPFRHFKFTVDNSDEYRQGQVVQVQGEKPNGLVDSQLQENRLDKQLSHTKKP
jgi:hypothetical protein